MKKITSTQLISERKTQVSKRLALLVLIVTTLLVSVRASEENSLVWLDHKDPSGILSLSFPSEWTIEIDMEGEIGISNSNSSESTVRFAVGVIERDPNQSPQDVLTAAQPIPNHREYGEIIKTQFGSTEAYRQVWKDAHLKGSTWYIPREESKALIIYESYTTSEEEHLLKSIRERLVVTSAQPQASSEGR